VNHHQPNKQPETFLAPKLFAYSSLAVAGAAALNDLPFVVTSHAAPDDPIRIGLIGCGGRGSGAIADALGAATDVNYPQAGYHTENISAKAIAANASKNIKVVALADVFPDRLNNCREQLKKLNMNIADDMCFTGFEAYKKLVTVPEVNYVILATPPHFRPMMVKAAIEAGKNVFMEKPVAVDGPGVRMVIEAGELAKQKNLAMVAWHAAAAPEILHRDHEADPRWHDWGHHVCARLLERRRDLGDRETGSVDRYGVAVCGTGTTSPGWAATTSWSNTCTTWMLSIGP
jgi:hypothetical protein